MVIRNIEEDTKEYQVFRKRFSIWDPVIHQYTMQSYYKINNDIYMPSSVGVQNISWIFPKKKIVIDHNIARSERLVFNMKNQPRNKLQQDSISFLMKLATDKKKERLLSLATDSGKTYISINVMSRLMVKSLIVIDTVYVAEQWKEEILKHTDLKEEDIVLLSGMDSVEKAVESKSGKVYIAIHRTLGMIIEKDSNGINKLMNDLGIGLRIFDEAHTSFKNMVNINSLSNVLYTIYLTATPNRSDYKESFIYSRLFDNIPVFSGSAVDKYHTVVIYPFNSEPSESTKAWTKTQYGFSIPRWASHLMENNDKVFDTLDEVIETLGLIKNDVQFAVVLPTIELIDAVKDHLTQKGHDVGLFISRVHKDKRAEELSKNIILTNDKMFDKAVDLPSLDALINFITMSSTVKLEQLMGRLRYREGKESVYIDVIDQGFDTTRKHLTIRKRFYKKYKAKKIIEIKK